MLTIFSCFTFVQEENLTDVITCKQQSHISKQKVLLAKNKKHAERTIIYMCGALKCKNILAETEQRFQKYTA
jgi:hypothetical protein